MNDKSKIRHVFRIKLRLHYSWIFVIIFMAAAVTTQFSTGYPLAQRITLGVIASLLFFLIMVFRRFLIAIIATRRGAVLISDTLFATGTVLEMDSTTINPEKDVFLAVVGLLANLVVAGILFVIYLVLAHTGSIMVHVLVQWLAFICFMLALFNFAPGLPLDGGRVLRALVWKTTGDYARATRIFSWLGWFIGLAFILAGTALVIITRQWFVGVVLILPGLILQNSATHQRRLAARHTAPPDDLNEAQSAG